MALFRGLNVAPRLHNGVHKPFPPPPWQRQRKNSSTATSQPRPQDKPKFWQTTTGKRVVIGGAIAGVLAIVAALWLWTSAPEYRVLFSNYTDKDGGAITAALDQMGVKYKFSDGGSAILVPADRIHDLRLKLAAQGLPRAGNVGFELLENQKLGTSQFVEQVNYQRSLEGELAQFDPVAGRRQLGARAPGAAEAVRVRARPAEADRVRAAEPAAGPHASTRRRSAPSCTWSRRRSRN